MADLYEHAATLAAYELAPPVELFMLPYHGNSTQNIGVRTGSGEFVLRTYSADSEANSIRHEHHLLGWLAEAALSFAVPVPVPTRNDDTVVPAPHGWQSMSTRLPGARLNRHDPEQVMAFGAALGELHMALSQYPNTPHPHNDPLRAFRAPMLGYLSPFSSRQTICSCSNHPPPTSCLTGGGRNWSTCEPL